MTKIAIFLSIHLFLFKLTIADNYHNPVRCQEVLQGKELDSLNARFVGSWPFGESWALALDSVRNIAFLGSGGGVLAIDITNPSSLRKLGEIRRSGKVAQIALEDNLLYIHHQNFGLEIWDVTDLGQPTHLSSILGPRYPDAIAVKDSFAYIGSDSLRIYNISDPRRPFKISSYGNWDIGSITISDSFAYISTDRRDSTLIIVNIQDPLNPYTVGFWRNDSLGVGNVTVLNNYAYCPNYYGLQIVDVSNPSNPFEVGSCRTPGIACAVAVRDSYAYVADGDRGITIINVRNPTNPFVVANLTPVTWCWMVDVLVLDSFAYLSDGRSKRGLWVVNINNPLNPFEAGFFSVPGWSFDVVLEDNYAYLVGWRDGLRILNIENPAYPYEVGSFATEHGSQGVAIRDTLAYLCDFAKGLRILNISDRTRPYEIGFWATATGACCAVAISGSYAYIADGSDGLKVINIENPSNPYEVGFYDTYYAWDVAIQDSFAYIADGGGLLIINIQNPSNPYEVGSLLIPDGPVVIAVKDSYAFVGGYDRGNMRIINIGNPANPYEVGFVETYGPCFGISLAYPYVYVSDWFWGFWIAEISEPSNPIRIGYYCTGYCPYGLASFGSYVYVAASLCGLQIYENLLLGVKESRLPLSANRRPLEIYPNPAKSYLAIRLPLTANRQSASGGLKIFDVSGKSIKEVVTPADKSEMKIPLKGMNPGIYFLRIGTETKKFLVVK